MLLKIVLNKRNNWNSNQLKPSYLCLVTELTDLYRKGAVGLNWNKKLKTKRKQNKTKQKETEQNKIRKKKNIKKPGNTENPIVTMLLTP